MSALPEQPGGDGFPAAGDPVARQRERKFHETFDQDAAGLITRCVHVACLVVCVALKADLQLPCDDKFALACESRDVVMNNSRL